MSVIANIILGFAKSVANTRGSFLAIRIRKHSVSFKFVSKNSDKVYWEDHYPNVAFYFGDSAVPFRFEADRETLEKSEENDEPIDLLDNAISTRRYENYMVEKAEGTMFNVKGASQDLIIKLLYITVGISAMILIVLLAMYGGA